MTPDYSFDLIFEQQSKESIIQSLGSFCVNTNDFSFNPGRVNDDCQLSFVIDLEPALAKYAAEYPASKTIENKVIIGPVALWIHSEKFKKNEIEIEVIRFTFWPQTSLMNRACVDSQNLKSHFIKLLEDKKGIAAYIDRSDGSFNIFWER